MKLEIRLESGNDFEWQNYKNKVVHTMWVNVEPKEIEWLVNSRVKELANEEYNIELEKAKTKRVKELMKIIRKKG